MHNVVGELVLDGAGTHIEGIFKSARRALQAVLVVQRHAVLVAHVTAVITNYSNDEYRAVATYVTLVGCWIFLYDSAGVSGERIARRCAGRGLAIIPHPPE